MVCVRHLEDPVLEVHPLFSAATGRGRSGKEAVVGATSEAFARRLRRRYALIELPSTGAAYRLAARYLVCGDSAAVAPGR